MIILWSIMLLALSNKPVSPSGHITNGLLHQAAPAPGVVLNQVHAKISQPLQGLAIGAINPFQAAE
jgi:hypothetical protein